ncbi:MAG: hypothetical protein ACRCXZ_07745 [Patescibacteria group bacterium]
MSYKKTAAPLLIAFIAILGVGCSINSNQPNSIFESGTEVQVRTELLDKTAKAIKDKVGIELTFSSSFGSPIGGTLAKDPKGNIYYVTSDIDEKEFHLYLVGITKDPVQKGKGPYGQEVIKVEASNDEILLAVRSKDIIDLDTSLVVIEPGQSKLMHPSRKIFVLKPVI